MTELVIRKLESAEEVAQAVDLAKYVYNMSLRPYLQLPQESEAFDGYMVKEELADQVQNGKLNIWGVCDGSKILGVSALTDLGHVTMLYIHPVILRQGWGRKLVRTMRVFAKSEYSFKFITLNANRIWTINVLRKMGFADKPTYNSNQSNYFIPMQAKTIYEKIYRKKPLPTSFVLPWVCGFTLLITVGTAIILWFSSIK